MVSLDHLHEGDEILITGTASSPNGSRFVDLPAVVATVSKDGYLKVWPRDEDGKIWFPAAQIESLTVTWTAD